jgi:hypothetical protein
LPRFIIMKIFLGVLLFFLTFGWLALLFSAIGLLYIGTIALSIILSLLLTLMFLPKISPNTERNSNKTFYLVATISLLISFATCYFATPTIFGGRDQGSISTAAINLSKNHSLKFSTPASTDLFQKYGPGRALNFPGFDYTKDGQMISRFPVAFTSYLASAFDLLGLKGIQYANLIPLFLFLTIFWLILREFFSKGVSFLGFFLAASFFPFLWFAKYTLTETYMLFLVWTGIYFLIRTARAGGSTSIREVEPPYLYITLAAFGLSALTRIEGIVFFLLASAYILLLQKKKIIETSKKFNKYILIFTLFLIVIYIYLNFPALIDSAKNLAKAFLPNSAKESAPSPNLYSYIARIFFNYNVLAYLVLGLAGLFWLAKNIRKNWIKSEFIPILITFPAFFYLLTPQITLDDPWFLRRFVFAVFPTLLIYSIYFINKFFYHKIFLYFTLVVLITANGVISGRFFTLSENRALFPQIEKISQKFGSDDLILVDRLATGSGFSLASEPLRTIYNKNAIYFFNAEDLKYINQDRYKNIYLIAPPAEEKSWYADLIKDKKMELQIMANNFLEPSNEEQALAVNIELEDFMGIWKLK